MKQAAKTEKVSQGEKKRILTAEGWKKMMLKKKKEEKAKGKKEV